MRTYVEKDEDDKLTSRSHCTVPLSKVLVDRSDNIRNGVEIKTQRYVVLPSRTLQRAHCNHVTGHSSTL
jgi:hypothetical protein